MSLALSNLAAQTQRAAHAQSRGVNLFRRRWMHNALKRQGIMMPALSPFMTEGTVTRWKMKEGDSFVAGDVLLQIENEVGMVDVEAAAPGILGKILTPDGTSHVPVEAVIALVARDLSELATIQTQSLAPTPPPFSPTPYPPSASLASPNRPMMSPRTPTMSPRTPSLFEMHAMGYGHRSAQLGARGISTGPRSPVLRPAPLTLDDAPRSPSMLTAKEVLPMTPATSCAVNTSSSSPATVQPPLSAAADILSFPKSGRRTAEENQLDGAAIRRMIVANLSSSCPPVEEFA
ncbi:hypothetical protein D9611_004301 [Ephemerocybe angulata]|uniref:Lipoyl-binding domain-containing protein n=1 Tax=Ephemerocybe angulata TaxID=980116 RepID=A0A8H5F5N1_9AGAR|nr:hypothetical protein D9611_004301 [Tulosesus angulatus]